MPGEMVFPMTPATSQPPPPPTAPFMQQAAPLCGGGGGEGSASESGGSGASAGPAALPHGTTQLLAEQLLHRQRVYEAALVGLEPSEGISDSIQQGGSDDSRRGIESGGPLQGDDGDVRVGYGRNRHLATTQLEFLTAAAEECRC